VLTCRGKAFAARVGASLLTALGLPELIAPNLPSYATRAMELANDPAQIQTLRQKLAAQLSASSMFAPAQFTAGYEAALLALANSAKHS
jgi:predicted O-linked N-acetylglucosamine transferase (SPINDLY family)